MGAKVAATFWQWTPHPVFPHSSSFSSQTLAFAIASTSSKRRSYDACGADGGSLACYSMTRRLSRYGLLGSRTTRLHRSKSCQLWQSSGGSPSTATTTKLRTIRRACSASLDSFSDEEFSKKIHELVLKFQVSDDEEDDGEANGAIEPEIIHDSVEYIENGNIDAFRCRIVNGDAEVDSAEPPWYEAVHLSSIERKANSVDLPLSLRIIKRKLQWCEGFREARESAYCSVKKAFSSMVFMIRELHSFTLQMRELLLYEDLQGIISRVHKEMHASFVWLFQQVFSHTPTLMVYVMILLANFTVYSIGTNPSMAVSAPPVAHAAKVELSSPTEPQNWKNQKFDSSSIKKFSVSSSNGKKTFIGGNSGGGGGGKVRPIAGGMDGDGWLNESNGFRTIVPDGTSPLSSLGSTTETESVSRKASREEELVAWNRIVEEAESMEGMARGQLLDKETMRRLVTLVEAKIEADNYVDYFKTELVYQAGLAKEPNNPLLLANYAQFLYLVAQDYDRAEEYFKRAIEVEPGDAESLGKYATFLWRARKDLWAAEEMFLEAISADPSNSYHSANYAHFLWNTGGEDTCYPLASDDNASQEA